MTSTGFDPTTSAMAMQCSYQLSYEVTKFFGLMCSRQRNERMKEIINFLHSFIPFTGTRTQHMSPRWCHHPPTWVQNQDRSLHKKDHASQGQTEIVICFFIGTKSVLWDTPPGMGVHCQGQPLTALACKLSAVVQQGCTVGL